MAFSSARKHQAPWQLASKPAVARPHGSEYCVVLHAKACRGHNELPSTDPSPR